jgi:hypothetical protein
VSLKTPARIKMNRKKKNTKEEEETRKNGFNLYLKITRHDNRPV